MARFTVVRIFDCLERQVKTECVNAWRRIPGIVDAAHECILVGRSNLGVVTFVFRKRVNVLQFCIYFNIA